MRGAAGLLESARPSILYERHPRQMENVGCSLPEFEAFVKVAGCPGHWRNRTRWESPPAGSFRTVPRRRLR